MGMYIFACVRIIRRGTLEAGKGNSVAGWEMFQHKPFFTFLISRRDCAPVR